MILRKTSATIEASLLVNGTATDPSPDSATVSVFRENGTTLVDAQDATDAGDAGSFTYNLTPTDTAQLDVLRADWTMAVGGEDQVLTTYHEVVGGFTCSLAAISAAIVAAGQSAPDTATLTALRAGAERKLEDACNVAFRPRYQRDVFRGQGGCELFLTRNRPLTIISATIGDTAVDTADLTLFPDGCLSYTGAWTCGELVTVIYEHGWQRTPEPITRAVVQLATAYNDSVGADGISRFREDDQEVFLIVPGTGGMETNLPDVNAAIAAYRYASFA